MKKYTYYLVITLILVLPVIALFDSSKAAVAPVVGTYLASVSPASDWTIMAQSAIGATPSDTSFLQELDGTGSVNDYTTYILAITSLGEDPRSFGNENLVYGLRQKVTNGQIGDETLMNDDIFGLIALRAAGVPVNDPLVTQTVNYIKNNQLSDGGWDWSTASTQSGVDYTAMGIMALIAGGVSASDTTIINASGYLSNIQQDDGGFPYAPNVPSNTASTAWALSALHAMEADINFWKPSTQSPIDYLNARQHADGYFLFDASSSASDLFTPVSTSYAAIALSGKYYPVSSITVPPSASFRLEGKNNTICNLSGAQGITAYDVVKASALECGYTYAVHQYDLGPYLTAINSEVANDIDAWIFVVNDEHLQVGAAQFIMTNEDDFVLYYGSFTSRLLRITHNETSVDVGGTTTALVERYDSGSWSLLQGATLTRGTETYITDANGQVNLSWSTEGAFYLTATADASVRSEKVLVVVGDAGEQASLPLSVTIGGDDDGGGDVNNPPPESVTFGVSGDLGFGTLNPGQPSTKTATLSNNSTSAIMSTATVSGSQLFINNLTLDSVVPAQWQKNITANANAAVDVTLTVPSAYTGTGTEAGTLIFWAHAQ